MGLGKDENLYTESYRIKSNIIALTFLVSRNLSTQMSLHESFLWSVFL